MRMIDPIYSLWLTYIMHIEPYNGPEVSALKMFSPFPLFLNCRLPLSPN